MSYGGDASKLKQVSLAEIEKRFAECLESLIGEKLAVKIGQFTVTPPSPTSAFLGGGATVGLELSISSASLPDDGSDPFKI